MNRLHPEDAIVTLAVKQPAFGQVRICQRAEEAQAIQDLCSILPQLGGRFGTRTGVR
jgi:hypothetical protein